MDRLDNQYSMFSVANVPILHIEAENKLSEVLLDGIFYESF